MLPAITATNPPLPTEPRATRASPRLQAGREKAINHWTRASPRGDGGLSDVPVTLSHWVTMASANQVPNGLWEHLQCLVLPTGFPMPVCLKTRGLSFRRAPLLFQSSLLSLSQQSSRSLAIPCSITGSLRGCPPQPGPCPSLYLQGSSKVRSLFQRCARGQQRMIWMMLSSERDALKPGQPGT